MFSCGEWAQSIYAWIYPSGGNCKKFKALYGSIEGIVTPAVFDEYTTRRVLTMEWIEGTKLPWGDDSERLIGLGLECSIYQLLEEGFLHAGT